MDKKFLKQLARWHEDDEFQKIVDAILALPEEERDYDLTGQLARALNNLEDYETAAEVLLTVEAEGQHDPLWHYRLGYAYYYSDRFGQAKERFEQVLRLTPDDQDARMFLGWCDEELTPGGKVKKLNARLTTPEAMTVGKTFRQRTAEFWQWFTDNEPRLAAMIEKRGEEDVDKMVDFISGGVQLISGELNFNRRFVPPGGLRPAVVRDRCPQRLPCCRSQGRFGDSGTRDVRGGRYPRGEHGRHYRRPEQASRPDYRHGVEGHRPRGESQGSPVGDVRLCDRAAYDFVRPRHFVHGVLALRGGSCRSGQGDHREVEW